MKVDNRGHLMLLFLLIAGTTIFEGCNTTQERRTYQTLATTDEVVELAMVTLGQLNAAGKLTERDYNHAYDIYRDYSRAMLFAIDAAQFDLEKAAPPDVMALATQFLTLVEELDL